MVFVFEFPNQMSGDSFDLPAEAQALVDAAFAKVAKAASDQDKLAAMRQFHSDVKWTTIYAEPDCFGGPTAVLTINND